MTMNLNAISLTFAEHLPMCLAGGAAIVALAWAILQVRAHRSPRERFGVWFGALVAIAALLFLGGIPSHSSDAASTVATRHALFEIPIAWAAYAFVAWLAVVGLALARIAVGLWQLGRLKRSCVEIDQSKLDPELVNCLVESRRRVSACTSERATCPTAMGVFGRARIVLPVWAVQELSGADLRQVVLHELAHLQRWDDWTNLVQKVLRALLFFHPLVWWLETKLTLEREMACDDLVLRRTHDPRAYAECLARLAEKSFARRTLALAQAAVGKLKQTSFRVARILHLDRPAQSRGWLAATAFVAISSCAGLLAVHGPNIIAFDEPETSAAMTRASAPEVLLTNAAGANVRPAHAAHVVRTAAQANVEPAKRARTDVELTGERSIRHEEQPSAQAIKATYVAPNHELRRLSAGPHRATRVVQQPAIVHQAVFVVVNDSPNGSQAMIWRVVWRAASVPNQSPVHKETAATKT
jgi:beta-lactamase regulating signal transducer with metallopeptidase domain